MQGLLLYALYCNTPHKQKLHLFRSGVQRDHNPLIIILSPRALSEWCINLFALYCTRKWHRFSHNWVSFQKMGPIILVAVVEHRVPTSPSYNGTSWISMGNYNSGSTLFILHSSSQSIQSQIWHQTRQARLQSLHQCFSIAGPRPGTVPWHQIYRAVRDSAGICHFSVLRIFHE